MAAAAPEKASGAAEAKKDLSPASENGIKESAVSSQTIRVSVDQLENLMVIASELVLTRNQLMQISRTQKDNPFAAPLQRLNHVTSELQEGVMKTRMQPIGNAWSKLPRIVRDRPTNSAENRLQMIGAENELDSEVLELIKDPLTHWCATRRITGSKSLPIVRCRQEETGVSASKPIMRAAISSSKFSDDGVVLSMNKIKPDRANGHGQRTDVATFGPTDQQYISSPVSTATQVTAVSGRGGRDGDVRTNIREVRRHHRYAIDGREGSRFLTRYR